MTSKGTPYDMQTEKYGNFSTNTIKHDTRIKQNYNSSYTGYKMYKKKNYFKNIQNKEVKIIYKYKQFKL